MAWMVIDLYILEACITEIHAVGHHMLCQNTLWLVTDTAKGEFVSLI